MNLDNPKVVPAQNGDIFQGDAFPPTMTMEPSTEQPSALPAAAPAQPQRIIVGNKVFNTTEEALAYADGFAQSQQKTQTSMTPQAAPVVDPTVKKRLGQLVFEDPDQAFELVQEQTLQKFRAEQRVVDENKRFWDDFYLNYSDLKGSEVLVDAVLSRAQSRGEMNVPMDQASGILAAKVRQEVSKIRNVPSGGQALPSNPAMVAGSSGASIPKTQTQAPVPTNFVNELRGMRKKG